MIARVPYYVYSPLRGVCLAWRSDWVISIIASDRGPRVFANQDGFMSLASICSVLAQPGMPDGNHVHLDEGMDLEQGSIKGCALVRLKDSGAADLAEATGEVSDHLPIGWNENSWAADLPVAFECVEYHAWDEKTDPCPAVMPIEGAQAVLSDSEFALMGHPGGLRNLASAFVTMAQPSTKEGASLVIRVPAFKHPESLIDVELVLRSNWPRWGITRSNGPWPEFEDAAVQG